MPAFSSTNGELFGAIRKALGTPLLSSIRAGSDVRNRRTRRGIGWNLKAVCAAALLLSIVPSVTTAEPITFTFQISDIRKFVDFTSIEPIPGTFPLRMTVSREPVFEIEGFQTYGPPAFSDIPLTLPPIPIDATHDAFTSLGGGFNDEHGRWFVDAVAFQGFESSHGSWQTSLDNFLYLPSPPPDLSVHTFASILGAPGGFAYLFDTPERSIRYHGTATLIDTTLSLPRYCCWERAYRRLEHAIGEIVVTDRKFGCSRPRTGMCIRRSWEVCCGEPTLGRKVRSRAENRLRRSPAAVHHASERNR